MHRETSLNKKGAKWLFRKTPKIEIPIRENVMNKQRMITMMLATTLLGLVSMTSFGAEDSRKQGPHQGPPPEAIEACKDKQVGDEVGFAGRKGETLEAICQERDGKLVAMPTSMPDHGPRQ